MSYLRRDGERLTLQVQVAPRASKNAIRGVHADALKIALTAAPVDGAANASLIDYLSELFDLPKGAFDIARGATSKRKIISISGIDLIGAERKIQAALEDG